MSTVKDEFIDAVLDEVVSLIAQLFTCEKVLGQLLKLTVQYRNQFKV